MRVSNRKGVAMFVVLGAVVLLTLLGFAGMSLAQKDQTLALDVQDLRSRDAALNASFQLALNRLVADPANMKNQLDTFITDHRKSASSPRQWFDFTKSPVELVSSRPTEYSISGGTEETSVQVSLVALSIRDAEGCTYITLNSRAMGRHGDVQDGLATFRLDGVGSAYEIRSQTATLPIHAAYFGAPMGSGNTEFRIDGGAYVGESFHSTDVGLNSGANMYIKGDFKWNGDSAYMLNASLNPTFDGMAYFKNGLKFNSGGSVTFEKPALIDGPIIQLQGSLLSKSFLWIQGTCKNGCVVNNRPTINANLGLVFEDLTNYGTYNFDMNSSAGPIHLGGGFHGMYANGFSGAIRAGTDLVIHGASNFWSFNNDTIEVGGAIKSITPASWISIKGSNSGRVFAQSISIPWFGVGSEIIKATDSVVSSKCPSLMVPNLKTNLRKIAAVNVNAGWPTHADFGIPVWMTKSEPKDNPPDSAWIRNDNAASVFGALKAWSASGYGTNFNACNLNKWWRKDSVAQTLFNGYLLIAVDQDLTVDGACGETSLHGKYAFVVRKKVTVNKNWPTSKTKNDIQVISVEGEDKPGNADGKLVNWGLSNGNFAGILFWDDPDGEPNGPTRELAMDFVSATGVFDTLWGAMTLTQSRTHKDTKMNTNGGRLQVIKDIDVFRDIASNLPGVLKSGADKPGNDNGSIRQKFTVVTSTPTPFVRIVTSQISFSPVGSWR